MKLNKENIARNERHPYHALYREMSEYAAKTRQPSIDRLLAYIWNKVTTYEMANKGKWDFYLKHMEEQLHIPKATLKRYLGHLELQGVLATKAQKAAASIRQVDVRKFHQLVFGTQKWGLHGEPDSWLTMNQGVVQAVGGVAHVEPGGEPTMSQGVDHSEPQSRTQEELGTEQHQKGIKSNGQAHAVSQPFSEKNAEDNGGDLLMDDVERLNNLQSEYEDLLRKSTDFNSGFNKRDEFRMSKLPSLITVLDRKVNPDKYEFAKRRRDEFITFMATESYQEWVRDPENKDQRTNLPDDLEALNERIRPRMAAYARKFGKTVDLSLVSVDEIRRQLQALCRSHDATLRNGTAAPGAPVPKPGDSKP